jgi:SAM-dependent methyltransferase
MTGTKKTHKNQSVKSAKRPVKVPRRTVGGGSIEVSPQILKGWLELAGVQDPKKFAQNAEKFRQLWRIFTSGRDRISPELLQDQGAAEAYVTGFHLPNAARATLLCHRIAQRLGARSLGEWFGRQFTHQRIFDLGCGSGAWTQVWLNEVRLKRNSVHLVDASLALLDIAAGGVSSMRASRPGTTSLFVETLHGDIQDLDFAHFDARKEPGPGASLDVYMLGYVWNELGNDPVARRQVMERLDACVAGQTNALVLLAEPATDELAWEAMALRNELCANGWAAIYPCPWSVVACPMLDAVGGVRDWCFSEGGWRKPPEYMKLEEATGIAHNKLNSAMFAFVSPEFARRLPDLAPAISGHGQVVVGRPSIPGGRDRGFSYLLCTPHGLMKTVPKHLDPKFAKPRGSTVTSVARPAASATSGKKNHRGKSK